MAKGYFGSFTFSDRLYSEPFKKVFVQNKVSTSSEFYIKVCLVKGWQSSLWYKVSNDQFQKILKSLQEKSQVLIFCHLRSKRYLAKVLEARATKPEVSFDIKTEDEPFIFLPNKLAVFFNLIESLFGESHLRSIFKIQNIFDEQKLSSSELSHDKEALQVDCSKHLLTPRQLEIFEEINKVSAESFLLHGVTGSGKSKIYLELIKDKLRQGKSVLFIVPEVSLAINFLAWFKDELRGSSNIFSWHSGFDELDLKKLSKAMQSLQPILMIGVHLPIFLPIENLGLIIIDEEHEDSFFYQQRPFLDTRQLCLLKAQIEQIPLVFGSATPRATTYHKHKTSNNYAFLEERFSGNMPKFMIEQIAIPHKNFWLTKKLITKLKEVLSKKEQAILFINRRGWATSAKCLKCKNTQVCPNCSVSLTVHSDQPDEMTLQCHYCDFFTAYPAVCCGESKNVEVKGFGTEKVASLIEQNFPEAKILVADQKSIKKKSWGEKIQDFAQGKFDILIGTKTISKGLHLPKVSLVCIVWADLEFAFPDYKSTEKGFQQILQVGGRSGRELANGQVLVQTMQAEIFPEKLSEFSYLDVLEQELQDREEFSYPPFSNLIFIQTSSSSVATAQQNIKQIKEKIPILLKNFTKIKVLGPSKAPVFKKRNSFSFQLLIKIPKSCNLKQALSLIAAEQKNIDFDFWLES